MNNSLTLFYTLPTMTLSGLDINSLKGTVSVVGLGFLVKRLGENFQDLINWKCSLILHVKQKEEDGCSERFILIPPQNI